VDQDPKQTLLLLPAFRRVLVKYYPVILVILNLVIRSVNLLSQDIGLDEPFSIYHAQFDFSTIIAQLEGYNNPPLYELILHVWTGIFGISPLSVRTLPMLFAVFSPLLLYYFVRKIFSERVAVCSSLLLSFSTLLQFYAHDCRAYSLFLFLSICSMYLFVLLLENVRRLPAQLLFIVSTTLLIYAHYFGFFIIFFQVIFLLLYHRKILWRFIIFYLCVLTIYAPHLWVLFLRMTHSVSKGTWLEPPAGIDNVYNMLWSFSNQPVITILCILILLASLIMVFVKRSSVTVNRYLVLIMIWLFFALFGMFIISFWVPMYIDRYLIYALPAYYILITACIEFLFTAERLRATAFIVFTLCFALSINFNPDKNQHVKEVVELVKSKKDNSVFLLSCNYDFMTAFAYYYDREAFASVEDGKEYHHTDSLLRAQGIFFLRGEEQFLQTDLRQYEKALYLSVGNQFGGNNHCAAGLSSLGLREGGRYELPDSYAVYEYIK
jgi:mannosyltransferase